METENSEKRKPQKTCFIAEFQSSPRKKKYFPIARCRLAHKYLTQYIFFILRREQKGIKLWSTILNYFGSIN